MIQDSGNFAAPLNEITISGGFVCIPLPFSLPLSLPPCSYHMTFRKEVLFSTRMLWTLGAWGSPDSEIPVSQSHLTLRTGVRFGAPTLSPSHRNPGQRGRESGPVLSIPGSRIHMRPPLLSVCSIRSQSFFPHLISVSSQCHYSPLFF